MRLSDLINQLQKVKDQCGNLYVFCGDTEAGWVAPVVTEQEFSHYLAFDSGDELPTDGEKVVVL